MCVCVCVLARMHVLGACCCCPPPPPSPCLLLLLLTPYLITPAAACCYCCCCCCRYCPPISSCLLRLRLRQVRMVDYMVAETYVALVIKTAQEVLTYFEDPNKIRVGGC